MCKLCVKQQIKNTISSFGCLDDAQLGKRDQINYEKLSTPKKESEMKDESLANEILFFINKRKQDLGQASDIKEIDMTEESSEEGKTKSSLRSVNNNQTFTRKRSKSVQKFIKNQDFKFGEIRVTKPLDLQNQRRSDPEPRLNIGKILSLSSIEIPRETMSLTGLANKISTVLSSQQILIQAIVQNNKTMFDSLKEVNRSILEIKQSLNNQNTQNQTKISENGQKQIDGKLQAVNKHSLCQVISTKIDFKYGLKLENDLEFPLVKDRNFS